MSKVSARFAAPPAWLDDAILYNIYPQSFFDSNGDGVGDLKGIHQKLDYVESLGVTAVWLNPIYPSPFRDAGYDVTDYLSIAPRYGTMRDFRGLLAECHRRGLKLLLDFVPGHTSTEHPWFRKSAEPSANRYSNWYIWSDSGFGDAEPQMVRGYCLREGHYLPNFFYFQPSLNYGYNNPKKSWQLPTDHPDVLALKAEMRKIMRHWLDMGVDGFRVDMASCLVKDDVRANFAIWEETRDWMDRNYRDRVLISEWSWPDRAISCGFHVDFMIHFNNEAYNSLFRAENGRNISPSNGHSFFDVAGKGNIRSFLDFFEPFLRQTRHVGHISLPTGNHDIPRLNHGRTTKELKVAMAFLLTMPGVPTIYYGDEIGMRNLTGLPSKEGGYIRTQARTPMQWSRGRTAGFSNAKSSSLYLPVDPNRDRPNVASQEGDTESLLNFVRSLIKLRRSSPALRSNGDFKAIYAMENRYPFIYRRSAQGKTFIIALNPSGKPQSVEISIRSNMLAPYVAAPGTDVRQTRGRITFHLPATSFWIGGSRQE